MAGIPLVEDDPQSWLSQPGERRAVSRIHTVCIAARVAREHDVGLFRVQNISDTGLMLVAHVELAVGERVTISLLENVAVEGTVQWSEGCCRGIRFDQAVDCGAILRTLAEERQGRRARALRLPLSRLATVYAEKGIRAARVTDVSRTGIGLQHDGSLETGMAIKVILESGVECSGTVRWSSKGHAGIQLLDPLNSEELESARGF